MRGVGSTVLVTALITMHSLLFAAPIVQSVSPAPHAIIIPASAHIVIDFNVPLNPASVVASTLKAWGHWSGMMTGKVLLENNNTRIRFVPARPFSAGELVTVFLSKIIQDSSGQSMPVGYSWTYWIRTAPASMVLQEVQRVPVRRPGEPRIQTYGANGGDVNGDGHLDIVVVNEISHDIRVFLNDGQGTYGTSTIYPIPTGSRPSTNESVDLDGDGVLDFACGNSTGDSVSIFIGNGDGTFQPVRNYQTASGVRGLCILDADGDGNLDIVTANRSGNNVSILRNNGNGTFATRVNMDANCSGETSVAAADANGDGILDLFVAAYNSNEVAILLGNGAGGFTFSSKVTIGSQPWMIAVGDVNGDGKVDAVTVNSGNASTSIAFGNGLGGFSSVVSYPTGNFPLAIDLGDIDGDGDLDLVSSNYGSGTWTVYENNGSGIFGNPRTLQASSAGSCATLYDYDNDGDLDMTGIDEIDDLIFVFRNGPPVNVIESAARPLAFALEQNYPNPFNPSTTFAFSIRYSSFVILEVYDVLGREIATLVNELKQPGSHVVTWDATGFSSGIYYYRLFAVPLERQNFFPTNGREGQAGRFVQTRKLAIIR
jgi:hypothetical protein